MPAVNDGSGELAMYRASAQTPFFDVRKQELPPTVSPKQVTLRDRVTIATLVPFPAAAALPHSLLVYLCDQLNKEIEKGDTYPMDSPMSLEEFGALWFSKFGAVMLLGEVKDVADVQSMGLSGADWKKTCLGSFSIKPNYPGRSSHVCNGAFLVTDASRNRGVGRLMGECYLEWAPQLGYTYSVFNLVYETNVASCRIWDALGFKRIGRVPGCGNLKSYPGQLIDAIIFGRDLGPEGEDFVSEERFDKIRYYLKHSKYPSGADRAEKSRLRSAATHYKLVGGQNGEPEKLMLKDKEVVSDPQQQYEIARKVHEQQHGGINKTTANIALKFHWVRIKETVSMVIKNCEKCKESPKAPVPGIDTLSSRRDKSSTPREQKNDMSPNRFGTPPEQLSNVHQYIKEDPFGGPTTPVLHGALDEMKFQPESDDMGEYADIPLDPQIMDDIQHHLPTFPHHSDVDPYEPNGLHETHGLGHDFDPTHLQHHDGTNDFRIVEDDDTLIASQAAAALRDQTMHLVDTSRLHNESQLHRDLLAAGFVSREEPSQFDGRY
ncbi:Protein spt10 [Ophidiomyces ophidiicola]|nr:Protein spt10 [Ophidiomyces ophidiicola]KAI1939090.1 Protein spt10 [Ophidiomyces ophidiicola]KAI1962058.1 Protein spt10 [Ophidiomyces ophidiicola]